MALHSLDCSLQAVELADLELLDFLLSQPGSNALGRDKQGCTLMHWAVLRTVRRLAGYPGQGRAGGGLISRLQSSACAWETLSNDARMLLDGV